MALPVRAGNVAERSFLLKGSELNHRLLALGIAISRGSEKTVLRGHSVLGGVLRMFRNDSRLRDVAEHAGGLSEGGGGEEKTKRKNCDLHNDPSPKPGLGEMHGFRT